MRSPEVQSQASNELPSAEKAGWSEFLDPREAIKTFQKLLQKIGETI
jgi:hypothetical protein